MGDIFRLSPRYFRGHAVENSFVAQGAPALGRSGAGTSSNSSGDRPPLRRQPQNRLQMDDAISAAWLSRTARSLAPTAPLAHTLVGSVDQSHRSMAPAPAALGSQKDPASAAPRASAPARALCAHDPALAQTLWLGAPAPTARAARSGFAASRPDDRHAAQPGVDGGSVSADCPKRSAWTMVRLLPARERWVCRGFRCGGCGWAFASSSPGGRGRATTRATNNFMAVTSARW